MVGDDDLGTGTARIRNYVGIADTAIHGYDQRGALRDQPLDRLGGHSVALGNRMGQIGDNLRAQAVQGFCQYGGPGDAIDVKISEYRYRFSRLDRPGQTRNGCFYSSQQIRGIRQSAGVKELIKRFGGADAARQQQLDSRRREAGRQPMPINGRRRQPPLRFRS